MEHSPALLRCEQKRQCPQAVCPLGLGSGSMRTSTCEWSPSQLTRPSFPVPSHYYGTTMLWYYGTVHTVVPSHPPEHPTGGPLRRNSIKGHTKCLRDFSPVSPIGQDIMRLERHTLQCCPTEAPSAAHAKSMAAMQRYLFSPGFWGPATAFAPESLPAGTSPEASRDICPWHPGAGAGGWLFQGRGIPVVDQASWLGFIIVTNRSVLYWQCTVRLTYRTMYCSAARHPMPGLITG